MSQCLIPRKREREKKRKTEREKERKTEREKERQQKERKRREREKERKTIEWRITHRAVGTRVSLPDVVVLVIFPPNLGETVASQGSLFFVTQSVWSFHSSH